MSDEKIMPDEIFNKEFVDVIFATHRSIGGKFSDTIALFDDVLSDTQKHILYISYKQRRHIASTKIQDRAISILLGHGYIQTTSQKKRLEAQRRIKIEKPSKARPVVCFVCKAKPKSKRGEDSKTQIVCPNCGNYSYREKKLSDAIIDWNRRNMKLEMESGLHPSKWGSEIASSRPVDRVAARVTKSHVGIKPLKLTEAK